MSNKLFCTSCGSHITEEQTGEFCGVTGKPQIRRVCSKTPCQCDGHVWEDRPKKHSFDGLIHAFLGGDLICRRCGKIGSSVL
jgi:hypothetical protein